MATETKNSRKKQLLRNNEYYDIQEVLDELYKKSSNNYKFKNLLELVTSEKNIKLAYRNIKKNKGSRTEGVNKQTIKKFEDMSSEDMTRYVKNRFNSYYPHKVKRVDIPKTNGNGTRPLGIPTIEDRLIQQCIKQILEPICEAKFHNHSYGFRPNRSAHHAIARSMHLINQNKLHYVIDIDIKGFFDNVNHGKLLKQLWALGIQDKRVISIISKMLKAEIDGIGIPDKGTPQGGILSPLLSNVVLNELDWWISNQWETFETRHDYRYYRKDKRGKDFVDHTGKYRAMRNSSNLKEMYIVRYADDFKIFCKNHKSAEKIFIAVTNWLNERLGLDISPEKSKIVNLKSGKSEFLGFEICTATKGNKRVAHTFVSKKAKERIIKNLKEKIKIMGKNPRAENVMKYNSVILGVHNYYRIATMVNLDFSEINFLVSKSLYNRTKNKRARTGNVTKTYGKLYGRYNFKKYYIAGIELLPIAGIKNKAPMNFSQETCNYTVEGRAIIHKKVEGVSINILRYMLNNPVRDESAEYNDNRLSLYVGQKGKCGVSGKILQIGEMHAHHKKPRNKGGTDKYSNLILVTKDVHILIHAVDISIIDKYKNKLNLDKKELSRLNELRLKVGNFVI